MPRLATTAATDEPIGLNDWPALNQADYDDDNRDNQKDVDEAPERVAGNQTQEPEHEQDDEDGPQHRMVLLVLMGA
jgi:hypothetical protein